MKIDHINFLITVRTHNFWSSELSFFVRQRQASFFFMQSNIIREQIARRVQFFVRVAL